MATSSTSIFQTDKKERIYRWGIITGMSLVFALIYNFNDLNINNFIKSFFFSFLQAATYWNGTMFIFFGINRFFPIDKHMKTTIVLMFLIIGIFVVFAGMFFGWLSGCIYNENYTFEQGVAEILMALFITYFISTFYAASYFFKAWRENLVKNELLERTNLEARYETLKTQINPHFLFNSLNTLLTLVADNDKASKYVESLSEFMRTLLQNQSKQAVLLRDELKVARQYIFLQQYRFGPKLQVSFDIDEKYFHFAVAPLAIQMLLENAIKHNVLSSDNPLFVKIYIENEKYIVVENNLQPKIDQEPSTGLGLNNIRNRYAFLIDKEILVLKDKGNFVVKIPLFEVSI